MTDDGVDYMNERKIIEACMEGDQSNMIYPLSAWPFLREKRSDRHVFPVMMQVRSFSFVLILLEDGSNNFYYSDLRTRRPPPV